MPHANIWIRKKNEQRWNELEDKSDWVNKMLEEGYIMVPGDAKKITEEMYTSPKSRPAKRSEEPHVNFLNKKATRR